VYITKIELTNVRCFKNLELEFAHLGSSALLSADNGDGKTTILRSIAMGLCDESSSAALFRELPGKFVRKGVKEARIKIRLQNSPRVHYEIETIVNSLPAFERVTQKVWKCEGKRREKLTQETFPWKNIFVCGYGAGRVTQGSGDYQKYAAVDAVYTLFCYDEPLQNPELAMRRLIDEARNRAGNDAEDREESAGRELHFLCDILKDILNLEAKDRVSLTSTGIQVKGHWGRCSLGALGDGYKGTITWVLDLLWWRSLHSRLRDLKNMPGIVLVDEIEQHLHPRWQQKIMQLLHDTFPKIQFIATTHSPLVVSGCKHCAIHVFRRGKHIVDNLSLYGALAEDVYNKVMGLSTSRPEPVRQAIQEFGKLHFQSLSGELSPEKQTRLRELKGELATLPETDPVEVITKLGNLRKNLEDARRSKGK